MSLRAKVNNAAAAKYDEPWFRALPVAVQQRYHEQDFRRIDAAAAVDRENLPVVKFKPLPPAVQRFVELCAQQARENLDRYAKRNRAAWIGEPSDQPPQTPPPDVLADIRRELGITPAVEQPAAAD